MKKNNSYQAKSLRWSIGTFIAVSIYTAITAGLFVLGYLTFDNEKTNVYYSQRASVILNNLLPILIRAAAAAGTNHQRMRWSDRSRAIGAYAQGMIL
jgi:hypothetical protein